VDTYPFVKEVFIMPTPKPPYPGEFRRKMIDLVSAGRSPEELAEQFEPTTQMIRLHREG
jgi:transposase